MRQKLVWLALLLLLPAVVSAQTGNYAVYSWEAGDLVLAYPSSWDAPVPSEFNGRQTLQLAQTLAANPDTRPPGIPFITLTIIPNNIPEVDLIPFLQTALGSIGITTFSEPSPSTLIGFNALSLVGSSDDSTLLGFGRAAELPGGQVLVVTGRALIAQRDTFQVTFDTVAASLVLGAASEPIRPTYGVLWHTLRTPADGTEAFLNLVGIAVGTDNRVYSADPDLGVIQFDALTGTMLAIFSNENLIAPSDLDVSGDGVVYVSDLACQCVHVLDEAGVWGEPLTGFGLDAPASIVTTLDGTLYATDISDDGVLVRVFRPEGEENILLNENVTEQPILVLDRAEARVLAVDNAGGVYTLEDDLNAPVYELNTFSVVMNDLIMDLDDNFLAATDGQGVIVLDAEGQQVNLIGRIVANSPLAGEFVNSQGVALGADGTIYIADSDGAFGAVTAMSASVGAGRVGATTLIPEVPVTGTLNTLTMTQNWTLNGIAGQIVTLSAVDASRTETLDVALRLIAPDGTEEAANDDHETGALYGVFDAQIPNHVLQVSGAYIVQVDLIEGSGTYSLGVSTAQLFELNAASATTLHGRISDAIPAQRWEFNGLAGQVFTITMQAEDGTLDAVARLIAPSGEIVAENDDAQDSALGKDAQLVQVRLPADGVYIIEAARFDGEGGYTLVIVATS